MKGCHTGHCSPPPPKPANPLSRPTTNPPSASPAVAAGTHCSPTTSSFILPFQLFSLPASKAVRVVKPGQAPRISRTQTPLFSNQSKIVKRGGKFRRNQGFSNHPYQIRSSLNQNPIKVKSRLGHPQSGEIRVIQGEIKVIPPACRARRTGRIHPDFGQK